MGKPQVLFIHADVAVRESFAALIESASLAVRTFSSVEEFWQAYEPSHPGCVVLDLGNSTTEQVLAFCQAPPLRHPVVVLTQGEDDDRGLKSVESRITIVRPFWADELVESIQNAIQMNGRTA